MKRFTSFSLLAVLSLLVIAYTAPTAFAQDTTDPVSHGPNFVDENGDGYNDNAPDADGDGIPNGMDEDYVAAGQKNGKGSTGFVDEDGDGINDNAPDADGDGIPNGQDEDYVATGQGQAKGFGKNNKGMRAGQRGFIDEDGDGLNDRAVDSDGDGIPNGQDEDYVPTQDCTGSQLGRGARMGKGFGSSNNATGEQSGEPQNQSNKGNRGNNGR